MPLHLLALAVSIPLGIYHSGKSILALSINFFANATLLWSWFDFGFNAFNGVSWFLSTTVLFAALSPLIVRTISKIKKSKWIALIFAGILAIQFSLAFIYEEFSLSRWLIYVFPPVRLLDCISGCLAFKLAEAMKNRIRPIGTVLFLFLFLALGGGCYLLTFFFSHQIFQTAAWSIPSFGIVAFLYLGEGVSKMIVSIFGNKVLQWGGAITFEFFLFHELILRYLRAFYKMVLGREQDLIMVAGALILSLLWAAVLHYVVGKIKNRKVIKAKEKEADTDSQENKT